MRRPRFKFLRFMALAAMILSMSGVLGLTASAAPDAQSRPAQSAAQAVDLDAQICTALYIGGLVDLGGNPILGLNVNAVIALLLDLDLEVDLSELDAGLLAANVLLGGCQGLVNPPAPEPVYAPTSATITGPATGFWEVYDSENVLRNSGTFTNGVPVALGDYNTAGTFTLIASGSGYEEGSTTFSGGQPVSLGLTATPPAVVSVVLFVDPAVDGSYVGSCGGSPVEGTFAGGTAVIGQVYEGAYCELTLSATGYQTGTAAGYITDADGDGSGPLSGSLLAVEPVYAESFLTATGPASGTWETYQLDWEPIANGSFENGVPVSLGSYNVDGEYRVSVYAEGWDPATTTFSGGENPTLAMTESVAPTFSVYGYVVEIVDGEYVPVPGALVRALSADGTEEFGSATADGNGFFQIDGLEPGTYYLPTTAEGYELGGGTITIEDADLEVAFALTPSAAELFTISGVVVEQISPGVYEPVAGATVEVRTQDGTTVIATVESADDGTFSVDVPNGTYYLPVTAEGYELGGGTVTVAGADVEVAFALTPTPTGTFTISGGVVNIETYLPIAGATVEVRTQDGTTLTTVQTAADGTFSVDVPNGTYYLPVTAEGYELGGGTVTVAGADVEVGFGLTPSATDLFTISGEVVDAETGEPIEGALIEVVSWDDDNADVSAAAFLLIETTTDANGRYAVEVPNGIYDVVASATGYVADYETVTVDDEDVVVNFALETETTGWLVLDKFYCEDATTVSFNAGVVDDDCENGAAFFTVYQYGDGTADYVEFPVWESGFGVLELEPGLYDLVEEGTNAKFTFEVALGEPTFIEVVNPGVAPAPRDGTVNISVFACSNITETVFTHDGYVATYAAGLPTFEPACEPGTATLTFYLVGDGTADYEQVTVNGAGSIELAPGTYEVVEEGTQARTFITVFAGDIVNLDVQIPTGDYEPGSSVNIAKFYCDTVTEVEWLSLGWSEYSDRDEPWGAPDCTPGAATFTFYLYGDGTADYAQIRVNGAGSIGLEPGIYQVVEEETQATFDLEVLEGENTILIVNNPMPEDGHVPGGPDDDGDGHPHKPGKDKYHHHKHGKDASTAKTAEVNKLPSTGAGSSESTDALAMAAAAVAALAGAGALRLRKDS